MGRIVDLYDVKVVDGFSLRFDIVLDLDSRLNYIFDVYELYEDIYFLSVDTDALTELKEKCFDAINIITYLRSMSLLSDKSLYHEFNRLKGILLVVTDILERRED